MLKGGEMRLWIRLGAVLLVAIPCSIYAIDYRPFLSWSDPDMEQIEKLKREISAELAESGELKDTRTKFEELTSLLDNNYKNLPGYLKETVALSEAIASGQLGGRHPADATLELRNRLSNIYGFWLLQFHRPLEDRVLNSLHKILLESDSPSARFEAAIALGGVGNSASLPALDQAKSDTNETVRKYAKSAVEQIQSGQRAYTSYEQVEQFWKSFED